jgi:HK97 family phage major capsid protein
MNKQIRALKQRKAAHVVAMRAILDKAASDGDRELTAEEQAEYNGLKAKVASTNAAIERAEELAAEEAQLDNVLEIPGATRISGGAPRVEQDPRRGFAHRGDFLQAVAIAGRSQNRSLDERLTINAAAPTTFGSEGVGQDGGFAIPPAYSTEIYTLSLAEDSLLPYTDTTPLTNTNSMVFPKDETTPWGTDGVRAFWQAEAAVATATKPKLGTTTLRLSKLMALVPLTDELIADGPALDAYVTPLMARSIRWKTNEAILQGNGNGQPQGCFKGAAAVTQAKDAAQAANTLSALNCANMMARLPPGSYPRALWMVGPDTLPSLFTLTLGNYPIYLPTGSPGTGGIQVSPYGLLLGRPIMVTQHAAAFSALGDLQLADLSYYRTIQSSGGIQTASSMHLYFDADATAFRCTFRVDGQPKIGAAIAQAKGSNTLSPFVQLQNR